MIHWHRSSKFAAYFEHTFTYCVGPVAYLGPHQISNTKCLTTIVIKLAFIRYCYLALHLWFLHKFWLHLSWHLESKSSKLQKSMKIWIQISPKKIFLAWMVVNDLLKSHSILVFVVKNSFQEFLYTFHRSKTTKMNSLSLLWRNSLYSWRLKRTLKTQKFRKALKRLTSKHFTILKKGVKYV